MAFVVADRVQEVSTTAGTGTLSLGGAVPGYGTFVARIGSGNVTYYTWFDPAANTWEVGQGTVAAGTPNTLSRDIVFSNSSGTTVPLVLAGNTINVWCDYPAEKAALQAPDGSVTAPELVASNGLLVHNSTVSASYTAPAGSNIISAGPMTVAAGATVSLPAGSNWVIY